MFKISDETLRVIIESTNKLDFQPPPTTEEIKKAHDKAAELHKIRIPLFPERLQRARMYGWTIQDNYLTPPSHFACRRWAALWESFETVLVPHWFWTDSVLERGA